jgi:hypothetical protein
MSDTAAFRLGKKPARRDPRTLRLADYRTTPAGLLAPPEAHWGHGLSYDGLGNTKYADCVEAGFAHQVQVWCDRAGTSFTPTAAQALGAYSAITGFSPGNPDSDQGTDMLTACQYWQDTGLAGHEVTAYLSVSATEPDLIRDSVAFYGGCYTGLAMPLTAQDQVGETWTVGTGADAAAGSWGGHCVVITGYSAGLFWCVTWGALQAMTTEFVQVYCDEAYCLLSKDWTESGGVSPSGLAWGQLQADLAAL